MGPLWPRSRASKAAPLAAGAATVDAVAMALGLLMEACPMSRERDAITHGQIEAPHPAMSQTELRAQHSFIRNTECSMKQSRALGAETPSRTGTGHDLDTVISSDLRDPGTATMASSLPSAMVAPARGTSRSFAVAALLSALLLQAYTGSAAAYHGTRSLRLALPVNSNLATIAQWQRRTSGSLLIRSCATAAGTAQDAATASTARRQPSAVRVACLDVDGTMISPSHTISERMVRHTRSTQQMDMHTPCALDELQHR
eukprot:2619055-Pleurochrysis_carterae.AAC.2